MHIWLLLVSSQKKPYLTRQDNNNNNGLLSHKSPASCPEIGILCAMISYGNKLASFEAPLIQNSAQWVTDQCRVESQRQEWTAKCQYFVFCVFIFSFCLGSLNTSLIMVSLFLMSLLKALQFKCRFCRASTPGCSREHWRQPSWEVSRHKSHWVDFFPQRLCRRGGTPGNDQFIA